MIKRIKSWLKRKPAEDKFAEKYKDEVRRNLIQCSNAMSYKGR